MDSSQGEGSGEPPRSRIASSVQDISEEKPPFGSRILTEDADVWSQNAWDHVPPPDDQDEIIAAALAKQKGAPVPEEERNKYNDKPAKHWDNFYKMNASNFFKTRKWLHLEFPELVQATQEDAGPTTIVEIGCGTGSASFPLLVSNKNPHLNLKAFDYSSHAIKLVQRNDLYLTPPVGTIQAAVWDLSSATLPPELPEGSADVVILIFVLSALHPHEWRQAISNIHKILRPGGLVLFRDYGRYDLTQLRFKTKRLLEDNFYIRGDKTRVYFFELDELALLFTGSRAPALVREESAASKVTVQEEEEGEDASSPASHPISEAPSHEPSPAASPPRSSTPANEKLTPIIHPSLLSSDEQGPLHPLFAIEQLGIDRRLIVNRKRQLKMYRVWMQGKFRKL